MAGSSNGFKRWAGRILAVLIAMPVLGYGLVCGYMYMKQDDLLYMAPRTNPAPPPGLGAKDIRLKTVDHETIDGWYSPAAPGKPMVLFLHGQRVNIHDGRYRFQRMHDKGVGYLSIDYRGFGNSTGKPSENGLYTDALAAYDFLIAKGYKPEQIVIHGHSLGSGVAAWLATRRFAKLLILEAPFTAAVDVGAERYPYLPVHFLMRDKFENRDRIKEVYIPVLIVHGDHDSVVPFAHGERLYAMANQPKRFVRMKGSDHSTLTKDGVYETVYWQAIGVE